MNKEEGVLTVRRRSCMGVKVPTVGGWAEEASTVSAREER
jgi:hypothetical protein